MLSFFWGSGARRPDSGGSGAGKIHKLWEQWQDFGKRESLCVFQLFQRLALMYYCSFYWVCFVLSYGSWVIYSLGSSFQMFVRQNIRLHIDWNLVRSMFGPLRQSIVYERRLYRRREHGLQSSSEFTSVTEKLLMPRLHRPTDKNNIKYKIKPKEPSPEDAVKILRTKSTVYTEPCAQWEFDINYINYKL